MSSYIDTSTIISYALKNESNHDEAKNLIDNMIRNGDDFYVSALTILELYSVLARKISDYRIQPGLENRVSPEMKVKIAVNFTIGKLNLHIIPDNNNVTKLDGVNVDIHEIYHESIKLAPKIKLRTLDLIHATYAYLNNSSINQIVSLDKDFQRKKREIENHTNIKVKYE